MGIRFLVGVQELHVFACFSRRIGRGPVVGGAAQKKIKKSFDRRPCFANFASYEITSLLPRDPHRRWFQR